MARKRTVRRKLARGKTWYKIHAPKVFEEKEIGETVGKDADSIIGRCIDLHYSELSGDITKHYIKIKLRINKVVGEHAYTEVIGYELSRPHLQRIIRRRISKIDAIKDIRLKDGKKVRIKGIAITQHKTNVSTETALRKAFIEEIEKILSPFDIESLVVALSTNQPQKEMQKKLNKIYPIRYIDVRKIQLLKEKKGIDAKS